MEAPDAAQDLSAVLLQYERNLLQVPLSPSNHVTPHCIMLPALEPCVPKAPMTSHKHNQPHTANEACVCPDVY